MKYQPIKAGAKERKDGDNSLYSHPCPTCGAPAWHWCISLDGSQRTGRAADNHRARATKPRNTELPDLREWWKSVSCYEGKHPRPRE